MENSIRGQSDLIGVILLTAVVVILVSVVGAFLFSSFQSETDSEPRVSIITETNSSVILVKHNGGATFNSETIEVILRSQTEIRTRLSDDWSTATADSSRFEAGDVWRYTSPYSDEQVRILIFDQESNTLLYSTTLLISDNI